MNNERLKIRMKGSLGEVEMDVTHDWQKWPTGNRPKAGEGFLIDEAIRLYKGLKEQTDDR